MEKTAVDTDKTSALNDKIIAGLARISEAIASDLYLEDILKLIVVVTAEVMGSNTCSIMLLDAHTHELVVKATQSISEAYNKKPNLKLGEGIAGRVAQDGKPMTVLDVRMDRRYLSRDIAVKENLCSLLSVPLVYKGKVTGVLNCYTAKPRQFSDNEISVLKAISNQAAVVIENFKVLVESKVIREELESRKAIERAKGLLMKKERIGEEDAYNLLRRYSMNHRRNMREIAEAIILTEEMGKDPLKRP